MASAITAPPITIEQYRSQAIHNKIDLYQKNKLELWVVYSKKQEVKIYKPDSSIAHLASKNNAVLSFPPGISSSSISVADIFRL